jgi:hypothetical protein
MPKKLIAKLVARRKRIIDLRESGVIKHQEWAERLKAVDRALAEARGAVPARRQDYIDPKLLPSGLVRYFAGFRRRSFEEAGTCCWKRCGGLSWGARSHQSP